MRADPFDVVALIAIRFVVAMLLLIVGVAFVLREIVVATTHTRSRSEARDTPLGR